MFSNDYWNPGESQYTLIRSEKNSMKDLNNKTVVNSYAAAKHSLYRYQKEMEQEGKPFLNLRIIRQGKW